VFVDRKARKHRTRHFAQTLPFVMNHNEPIDIDRRIHVSCSTFNGHDVKRRMHEILHARLHEQVYDRQQSTVIVQQLSTSIRDALKLFAYERYKFIVHIVLAQEQTECCQMTCRAFWDVDTDRLAQSIYVNPFLACTATAFAVFYY
jgi:hypothetical protein